MARFSKGTTDHDADGRMGGSRKGEPDMAKTPEKAPEKPAEAKKAPTTDERLEALERALRRQDKRLDQLEDVNGLRLASRGYKPA